eukprot:scaffold5393_cov44-Phaeocystis_antarctica.AAC.1
MGPGGSRATRRPSRRRQRQGARRPGGAPGTLALTVPRVATSCVAEGSASSATSWPGSDAHA